MKSIKPKFLIAVKHNMITNYTDNKAIIVLIPFENNFFCFIRIMLYVLHVLSTFMFENRLVP